MRKWQSIYIYYNIELVFDVLIQIVKILEGELVKGVPFFFIRYYDDHHHIRLRLFIDEKKHAAVLNYVKTCFKNAVGLKSCKISVKEYMPEVERYGGPIALKMAEKMFNLSSKCALKLIFLHEDNSYPQIILRGAFLNYITLKALVPPINLHSFLENYTKLWFPRQYYSPFEEKQIMEVFHKRLEHDLISMKTLIHLFNSGELDLAAAERTVKSFQRGVNKIREDLNKYAEKVTYPTSWYAHLEFVDPNHSILVSYIHMNNNRMGIKLIDEAYISFLLLNATK